ncbi:40S ribosomal protein S3a [Tupaia chinensis]|uniref:Small ribosomal subunit protein eS1 n=1 Tax=Tupaia chinensis TaxID=246437 RepID=L9KJA5_TUPCH|nr:40S ribosomal protein S3a [Tupaia chinensis]
MKGSKKGAKKKVVDPFSKKDWDGVKAPAMFNIRNIGKTLVTGTQGTKIASDNLKGRVFEMSLADLQNDEVAFRKFKLITEDVQGKNHLTDFHGMDLIHDKMCSMVKKWQTTIKAHVDVKTTNGYLLHLFCIGFKKGNNQIRKTSYAQHQQVRQIQKKMMEIMTWEVQTNDLKEVVTKLIPDSIGKDIEKACQSIYSLHHVFVRKIKMLMKPKFELGKLTELHGEGSSSGKTTGDETGAKVERADGYEPNFVCVLFYPLGILALVFASQYSCHLLTEYDSADKVKEDDSSGIEGKMPRAAEDKEPENHTFCEIDLIASEEVHKFKVS